MTTDLPRLNVADTLALIQDHQKPGATSWARIRGFRVSVTKASLQTFAVHGTTCRGCGMEATHFQIEPHPNPESSTHAYTLRLYGEHEGEPVLFTQDHTLARCLGGSDDLFNRAPMCYTCNQLKAAAEKMVCYDRETPLPRVKGRTKPAPRKSREKVLLWKGKSGDRRLKEASKGNAWW